MTAKHAPQTPLPWKLHGVQRKTEIGGFAVLSGEKAHPCAGYVANSSDAAYIAHAANAYPRLVEFVKSRIGRADADALLRELGEL